MVQQSQCADVAMEMTPLAIRSNVAKVKTESKHIHGTGESILQCPYQYHTRYNICEQVVLCGQLPNDLDAIV
jgi:hypothetical protein